MAYPVVTYTFTNGPANIIDADEVNTNFSDIINGLNAGSKDVYVQKCYVKGGTATLPAMTFGSSVSLGFFLDAADRVGFSGRLYVHSLKSGTTQTAACAVTGEVWIDTAASSVLKVGV